MRLLKSISPTWSRLHILVVLSLVLIVLVPYGQVYQHEFLALDDYDYISENEKVNQGVTIESLFWAFGFRNKDGSYWRPLTWLTHMLDFEMYGDDAGWHHVSNLLLHLLNVLLLYTFLYKATGRAIRSAVVAGLFAVHPINVESVAWLTERNNLLASCFGFLTLILHTDYVRHPTRSRYYLTFLAYLLCLLSKPILITIPFLLLLLDFWPYNRIGVNSKEKFTTLAGSLIKEKLPFFILSMASMIPSMMRIGNVVSINDASFNLRVSNSIVSYVKYMQNIFYPVNLSAFYPYPSAISIWAVMGSSLLLVGIISFCLLKYKTSGYLLIGWLWFLGTLVPKIGLIQAGAWPELADRWAYFPAIGIFLVAVWWVGDFLEQKPALKPYWSAGVLIALLSFLTPLSWQQVGYWANNKLLFGRMLETTENNFFAHNLMGYVLVKEKQLDKAVPHFKKAAAIRPKFEMPFINLGSIAKQKKQYDKALYYFKEVLEKNPYNGMAYFQIGDILYRKAKYEKAARYFMKGIHVVPNSAVLYNGMGQSLMKLGRLEDARACFHKAIALDPAYLPATENLNAVTIDGRLKGDTARDRTERGR